MHTIQIDSSLKKVLDYIYNYPESFSVSLDGLDVYFENDLIGKVKVGTIITDIPFTIVPLLKIKCWKLVESKEFYSLKLTLTI